MNIDKVDGNTYPKKLPPGRKVGGDKRFDQVLKDSVESIIHEECAGDEVSSAKRIDFPPLWDRGPAGHSALQRAYDILDLLEKYSQALGNPDMTLKGIQPIVTQIEQNLKGLGVQPGDNVVQNSELASIINEIAVRASVEAFKFQRGDYVA
jgi:hypothetical protein